MIGRRWILAAVAAALPALAASTRWLDGPWGALPGGRFRGMDEPCVASAWQEWSTVEELQLEVRPERPRSITTWSVVHDGDLYLPADFLTPWKRWPHQVMEDDRVRVRMGARIFRCQGERVLDTETVVALRGMAASKYALDPDGLAARSEVWWFRIAPR